jgi:SAM-dependent methyltransferase
MGKEQDSNYYNVVFENAPYYHKSWEDMGLWSVIWQKSLPILKEYQVKSILDIGSGMGQFGQACVQNDIKYKGIDFSEYAVFYSKKNKIKDEEFECVDVFKYDFKDEVDCFVSHEFLEHIEKDLEVIQKLPPNKLFIFSVPDFDDPGHVRWFNTIEHVVERYNPFLNNLQVNKITDRHYLGFGLTR